MLSQIMPIIVSDVNNCRNYVNSLQWVEVSIFVLLILLALALLILLIKLIFEW